MPQHGIKLEVALREDGALVLLLPGVAGSKRYVLSTDGALGVTARRILEAQANGEASLGLDGGPSAAQVEHWEKHQEWPKQSCRWCIEEGRAQAHTARASRTRVLDSRGDGTVIRVRRYDEGGKVDINLAELFSTEIGKP